MIWTSAGGWSCYASGCVLVVLRIEELAVQFGHFRISNQVLDVAQEAEKWSILSSISAARSELGFYM